MRRWIHKWKPASGVFINPTMKLYDNCSGGTRCHGPAGRIDDLTALISVVFYCFLLLSVSCEVWGAARRSIVRRHRSAYFFYLFRAGVEKMSCTKKQCTRDH